MLDAAARGDIEAAKDAYFADAAPLYGEVDSALAGLARVNLTEARALDESIGDKYRSSRAITLVALLLGFAVGAGIASSSRVASSPASAGCSRGSASSTTRTSPRSAPA